MKGNPLSVNVTSEDNLFYIHNANIHGYREHFKSMYNTFFFLNLP